MKFDFSSSYEVLNRTEFGRRAKWEKTNDVILNIDIYKLFILDESVKADVTATVFLMYEAGR